MLPLKDVPPAYLRAVLLFTPLLFLFAPIEETHAQGTGTVVVQQAEETHLGSFGLATPVGVIEGESKIFTSEKPAGNYALTVTPPAGAVPTINVYNNDTLTESFDSRTAVGTLRGGETLKFVVLYDFVLVGTVSIISTPPGLEAILKGPWGSQTIRTPMSLEDQPEGTYSVTYLLPVGCRPVAPIARSLKTGSRVTFAFTSACPLLTGAQPQPQPSPPPPPSPTPPPPPPPTRRPVSALRVSLRTGSDEIAAGASARATIRVLNRGTESLKNLSVVFRFDGNHISVAGARGATLGENEVRFAVAALPPNATWEESFAVKASPTIQNGATLTSGVVVEGEGLAEIPLAQRSTSSQIRVIRVLPKTGVPLTDALSLLSFALLATGVLSVGLVMRARSSKS